MGDFMLDQNTLDTAHLLRRLGFGATTDEIRAAAPRGLAAVTDDALHPEDTPDPINDDAIIQSLLALLPADDQQNKRGRDYIPPEIVKMWWTARMLATPHPLVEKMTLFWHGHFTSKDGKFFGDLLMRQNQMFRANALGNFRTLTLAVARDPEMLRYLNGNQNYKEHPNENFGRELMEIYTCGIGHYTEDDVKAAARAFSGWNLRGGQFHFNPYQHDDGPKTFLGQTGNWNGDDIIEMLVAHPATARRLCTQLFAFFAYPDPEPPVLDALVQTYYASGYDIRAVLGRIFRSQAFYSAKARNAVIKCPVQYVIGSVKMLGLAGSIPTTPQQIAPAGTAPVGDARLNPALLRSDAGSLVRLTVAMATMGQDLLAPPSVKGWDGGERWINTATLLARVNFANALSASPQAFNGQFAQAVAYVRQNNFTPAQWVDHLAEALGPLQLTPQTRQTLIEYVNAAGPFAAPDAALQDAAAVQPAAMPLGRRRFGRPPAFDGLEARLRGVIPLLMSTPEYQVC